MTEDQELKVMGVVLSSIEPLEPEARTRVVLWVAQKLSIGLGTGGTASKPHAKEHLEATGEIINLSTDTIATLIGAKSGTDLIVAAAAHLHFSKSKQTFTRQDLIGGMRAAPAHFKETFVNNLTTYLVGLTKADRLRLVGAHTYALSNKERQALGAKLANA